MTAFKFIGETLIESFEGTEFEGFTPADWVMVYIERYGHYDGDHHKTWVLDQCARIIKGTPVIVKKAEWEDHPPELRFSTGEPSQEYLDWVEEMKCDGEYDYDEGIAP